MSMDTMDAKKEETLSGFGGNKRKTTNVKKEN